MAQAMAASDAALAIWELGRRLGTRLAEEAIAEVEERVVEGRPELGTARRELRSLLRAAFEGQAPLL